MQRVIHTFRQGDADWHAHRNNPRCGNASELPALFNAHRYTTRAELLRSKSSGVKQDVSADQQRLFDSGHAAEKASRPHVAALLGEDTYPIVASIHVEDFIVSASLDGATMDEEIVNEHKRANAQLRAMVASGEVTDPHYYWQLEQQMLVLGAERAIFSISEPDGSDFAYCEYRPVPGRREKIIPAWRQFFTDLANYSPAAAAAEVKAAPVESLPAVLVEMKGELAVKTNLDVFGTALKAFVAKIPAKPSTDQEFADAEAACKSLKKAEDALQAESERALAGLTSVNKVRTLIAGLHKIARDARLSTDKLVDARKREIKEAEVNRGRQALAEYVRLQNESLGGDFIQGVAHDFPGAIAGLKKFDSLRNAIDTHLAERKVELSTLCAAIGTNVRWLRENASEFKFLFADTKTLVLKPHADFCDLCTARIDNHKAELARKEAAERERQDAEVARRVAAERERLEREAVAREQAAAEASRRELLAEQDRQRRADGNQGPSGVVLPAGPQGPSGTVVQGGFDMQAVVVERPVLQLVPAGPPSMNLSQINARIAPLGITVSGLEKLGFPVAAKQGAAAMFHAADFDHMVRAMAEHLMQAIKKQEAA